MEATYVDQSLPRVAQTVVHILVAFLMYVKNKKKKQKVSGQIRVSSQKGNEKANTILCKH